MFSPNLFTETILLCWHVESVAGSTDSLKPQALRYVQFHERTFGCPPLVGQGLTESAPPALRERAPAKQKSKGVALVLLPRGPRYTAGEINPPPGTTDAPVLQESLRSCFAETTAHGKRRCLIPREREQADFPRVAPPLCNPAEVFCLGWPTTGGHPKGLA